MSANRSAYAPRAFDRLQECLVWDNHACMPLRPDDTRFLPQLDRHRNSGVSVVVLNAAFDGYAPWHDTFKMLARFRTWVRDHPEGLMLIETADDVVRCKGAGLLGLAFDLEGALAVNSMPELVEVYYALGVRWMLLAYNKSNAAGGGCLEEDLGLTRFGRRVIDEMERCGMILDLSHTGYRTAREALEYSTRPVTFSHSNSRAVFDHPRNIPDDLIRACAQTGGVIGVNGIGHFLSCNADAVDAVVRHIDHIASIVGPQHVGLGLDFVFDAEEMNAYFKSHPAEFPPVEGYGEGVRMVEPECIGEIAGALQEIGWSREDIRGLLGENSLRVARQVWRPVTGRAP